MPPYRIVGFCCVGYGRATVKYGSLNNMNDETLQVYVEKLLLTAASGSGLPAPRTERLLNILVTAATKVQGEV
jgi:hypothetical protein